MTRTNLEQIIKEAKVAITDMENMKTRLPNEVSIAGVFDGIILLALDALKQETDVHNTNLDTSKSHNINIANQPSRDQLYED